MTDSQSSQPTVRHPMFREALRFFSTFDGLGAVPFRSRVRQAEASELALWNREEREAEMREALPAEEEMARMEEVSRWVGAENLLVWLEHPDERVPLALLKRAGFNFQYNIDGYPRRLYQRALRDAARERVLWTPLLDELHHLNAWPRYHSGRDRDLRGGLWEGEREGPAVHDSHVVGGLKSWLVESRDEEALLRFLDFSPRGVVWQLVASHGRFFPLSLVQKILAEGSQVERLAANPHLPPEAVSALWDWALHALEGKRESYQMIQGIFGALAERGIEPPERVLEQLLALAERGREGSWIAFSLLLHQPNASESHLRRALGSMRGKVAAETFVAVLAHPSATEELRDEIWQEEDPFALACALLKQTEARPEDLLRAFPILQGMKDRVTQLIKHPRANEAVWERVARGESSFDIRASLAAHPGARESLEVRRQVSQTASPQLLRVLMSAQGISPEEWLGYFRKVVRRSPEEALGILGQRIFPAGLQIPPSLLLPLFQSGEVEVRQTILRLSGTLPLAPEAPIPKGRGRRR